MSEVKSVLIVGVGGQGTLLASRLLGNAMVAAGHDVKVSEVHGMSQRGGSVETYVRYGEKVYSPVIEKGGADYILAFAGSRQISALPEKRRRHYRQYPADRSYAGGGGQRRLSGGSD